MAGSIWGSTPRRSIELECARRGRPAVVAGCCALVRGAHVRGLDRSGTVDDALVLALGGPPAQRLVDGTAGPDQRYWLRVWGARGLLWSWDPAAGSGSSDLDADVECIRGALADPVWRVREMAAKVVARHRLGACFDEVAALRDDRVARVRAAAARAVVLLVDAGA